MTLEAFLRSWQHALTDGGPLTLAIAGVAGILASAVCPCTLPVGIGIAGLAGSSESRSKATGILIAVAFFAGIVVNLALLGALAGQIGLLLSETFGRAWALGMALLSLAGAIVAWRGPRLKNEQLESLRRTGIAGAFAYGFIFSLGTSAAPLLLFLTAAAALSSPMWGFATALAFGIGRGLPFLLVGLFSGALMRFAGLSAVRQPLQVASALALLFVGVYYVRTFIALS